MHIGLGHCFVPTSHHFSPIMHASQEESTEKELSTFHTCNAETYHLSLPQRGTPQPAPVQEGYALFHHQDIWHGSGPNRSLTKHRRALVGHYISGDVKFCEGEHDLIYHNLAYIAYSLNCRNLVAFDTMGGDKLHLREIQNIPEYKCRRQLFPYHLRTNVKCSCTNGLVG